MGRQEVVSVERSGSLFIIGTQEESVLVDIDAGTTSPKLPTQSVYAHVHVGDEWQPVTDFDELPASVLKVINAF